MNDSSYVDFVRKVALACAEYAFAAIGAGPEEEVKKFLKSKEPLAIDKKRFSHVTSSLVWMLDQVQSHVETKQK